MKYYIATSLENHAEHTKLMQALTERGHTLTYDWTHHGPVWRDGLARIKEVAQLEHQGVNDADMLIMLWPGGRGTHVELGMGIALGKQCVLISSVEGHHAAHPDVCAFYHHPQVTLFRSVEEFLASLVV